MLVAAVQRAAVAGQADHPAAAVAAAVAASDSGLGTVPFGGDGLGEAGTLAHRNSEIGQTVILSFHLSG